MRARDAGLAEGDLVEVHYQDGKWRRRLLLRPNSRDERFRVSREAPRAEKNSRALVW